MPQKRFFYLVFFIFLIAATLALSYNGILVVKEPSAVFYALGEHYFNTGDFNSAINYFGKSIEVNPDFAEAYHNLGVAFYYDGDMNSAINFLKKSLEIKKDNAKAHYSIALVYYEIKDLDNAIFHLSKVTQLEPNNANAHFDLAVAYVDRFRQKELSQNIVLIDLEDLKEAVKQYYAAEELKPGFSYALSNAKIVEGVIAEYKNSIIK